MSTIPKICLNMIVKNESKIITRLLDSVIDIIDTFCICDTGSTDNTIELIQNYFQEKNISGKIIQEPFRDFGYNRSFSMKACEEVDADYLLLLDADMVFWKNQDISPDVFKQSLIKDAYYIYQGTEYHYYKNTRIVRNKKGFKYWGVTHEYVDSPDGTIYETIDKNTLFIKDIGDGGAKTDKFLRDIRLLTKGLEDLPNNDRYTFYLANSYRDSNQHEKAIEFYKKRIEIGGWIEEQWFSAYSIGKCWKELNQMDHAICAWLDAYNIYPRRIENLFEIIQHYRCTGKNYLAYSFYILADKMRNLYPQRDYLFMHKDIYDFKLDYELSILGYYCNLDNFNLKEVSMKVMADSNVSPSIIQSALSNYKFYTDKLIDFQNTFLKEGQFDQVLYSIGKNVLRENPGYFSSTPTICKLKEDTLIVNVRIVNYKINDQGGYENQEKIHTINVVAILEKEEKIEIDELNHGSCNFIFNWKVTREEILKYNTEHDNVYVGLEDIRIFLNTDTNILYYNANRGIARGNMVIEYGEVDLETISTKKDIFLSSENQHSVEKNWVLFPNYLKSSSSENSMIYGWHPLILGDIHPPETSDLLSSLSYQKTHSYSTPPFFKHLRGSCNGINITKKELWLLCHAVSYEDRRYYYHIMVVLDPKTLKPIRYTPFFTFEKEKVEYTLSLVEFGDNLLIGYSILDRETKFITVSKEWFSSRMIDISY